MSTCAVTKPVNALSPKTVRSKLLSSKEVKSKQSQKKIGMFNIGEKLGEGTFSKVCLGTHTLTNQKVAIKILEKIKIQDASDRQRIEKEINIHKKLMHSNIIQQYCVVETKNTIYIVTELCSGGELFEYIISKKKILESEACVLFKQLIAGVEYLHKMGVIHRDLKPENILFDEKNNLKIADFGLSNNYSGKILISTPCGSPCYAAPEMVQGLKYMGPPVDVWSCGIILFTMVCGYLPFEDENRDKLFKKISLGFFEIPKYISHVCKDLLKKVLNVDPKERFTFEDIKNHPWIRGNKNESSDKLSFDSPGLLMNEYLIPIDYEIVVEIIGLYKFSILDVITDILKNKHTNITISYYLLLKNKIQLGDSSVANIGHNSSAFKNYLESDISKLNHFNYNIDQAIDYHCRIIVNKISNKEDEAEKQNKCIKFSAGHNYSSDNPKQEKLENDKKFTNLNDTSENNAAYATVDKDLIQNTISKFNLNKFLTNKSIEPKESSSSATNAVEDPNLKEQANSNTLIDLTANYFSNKVNIKNKKHHGNYREYISGISKNGRNNISEFNCYNTEAGDNNEERKNTKNKEYYMMTEPVNRLYSDNLENNADKRKKDISQNEDKALNDTNVKDDQNISNKENRNQNSDGIQAELNMLSGTINKEFKDKAINEKEEQKNCSFDSISNIDLSFKQTAKNAPEKLLTTTNNSEKEKIVTQTVPPSLEVKKKIFKNFFESSMKSKLSEQYEKYVRKSHRFRNNSINQSYDSNQEENLKCLSVVAANNKITVNRNRDTIKPHQSFSLPKNIDYSKEQNPIRKKKFLNTSTVSVNIDKSGYDSNSFSFRENSTQQREKIKAKLVTNQAVSQSPSNPDKVSKNDQLSSNKKDISNGTQPIKTNIAFNETNKKRLSMYASNLPEDISNFTKNLKLNFPALNGIKENNLNKNEEIKVIKHRRNLSANVYDNPSNSKIVSNTIEKNNHFKEKSQSPDIFKNKIQVKKNIDSSAQNVLSICGKKTPEETIQILETILGKNTVQRMGNKNYSYQMKCTYYYGIGANKYSKKLTFTLDVNELKEIKDYYIIKANLVEGPDSTFSAVCRRIKNKFSC